MKPSESETPLLDALAAHREGLRFHMPGHHNCGEFRNMFGPLAELDVTELSYSDNLMHPSGPIAASERMTASVYGANHCLYSTQGSTLSAFMALFAARRAWERRERAQNRPHLTAEAGGTPGKPMPARPVPSVLLSRETHRSFFSACEVLGLEPVVLPDVVPPDSNLDSVCAAVVTSPDYYGKIRMFDFSEFARRGIRTIADSAHGAHLLLDNPVLGADMVLMSAHKFLPSLTQSAFLLVADDADAEACAEARNLFGTTSPSYLLMASIEYGVHFIKTHGSEALARIAKAKEEIFGANADGSARGRFPELEASDPLRIVWSVAGLGATGFEIERKLNGEEIFPEFSDARRVVFFLGLETGEGELRALRSAMDGIAAQSGAEFLKKRIFPSEHCENHSATPANLSECSMATTGPANFAMSYLQARRAAHEWIPIGKSAGRICAQNCGFYPPATALILAGERITQETADRLALEPERVFGPERGRILTVLEQEETI